MAVDDEAPKRAKYEQTYTQGRCKGLGVLVLWTEKARGFRVSGLGGLRVLGFWGLDFRGPGHRVEGPRSKRAGYRNVGLGFGSSFWAQERSESCGDVLRLWACGLGVALPSQNYLRSLWGTLD